MAEEGVAHRNTSVVWPVKAVSARFDPRRAGKGRAEILPTGGPLSEGRQ